MAITTIRLTNSGNTQAAVDIKFDSQRQLHRILPAHGGYVDVEDICTLDELNRFQGSLPPNVTISTIVGTSDIGDLPTEADVRARTGFPELYYLSDATLDLSDASGGGAACNIAGANLLSGQTKASYTQGAATSALTFTANRPGTNGNLIQIVLTDTGSGVSVDTDVTPAGEMGTATVTTITFESGVSTAKDIADAVNADAEAKLLMTATYGSTGLGTTIDESTGVNLAGGTGTGFKVYVGGLEMDVAGLVTDVLVPMQTRTLTNMVNGGGANVWVVSNGTKSLPLSVALVS